MSLPRPSYRPKYLSSNIPVVLGVTSMKNHTSNEGWQLVKALNRNGYKVAGEGTRLGTDVNSILKECPNISTVVVQDKREWDSTLTGDYSLTLPYEHYSNIETLKDRKDIFKLTVIKDAHHCPSYHKKSSEEIRCHGWIVYYDLEIVKNLSPFIRREHCIRTYHTIDPFDIPSFNSDRSKLALLSGAISKHYPIRQFIRQQKRLINGLDILPHPGYQNEKCYTQDYFQILNNYKVSICTASRFQYALRKIIESTAAGCMVVTDLQEKLPFIDENLYRINPLPYHSFTERLNTLLSRLEYLYDPDRQKALSQLAIDNYNYITEGERLSAAIEKLRTNYNSYQTAPSFL